MTLLLPDDATAQAWYASMRAKWPMLPATAQFVFGSGPAAALTNGVCQIQTTGFDDEHSMIHELGHILQELAQRLRDPNIVNSLDGSVGPDFNKARGLPWPYRGPNTVPAPQWADLGYEQFAEAFARLNLPGEVERTTSATIPWPGDDPMRAFFRGLFPVATPTTTVVTPPAPAPAPTPAPAPVPQPTQTPAPAQGVIPIQPRYCADSTTASDIPDGMAFVAGYIDGGYRWSAADWGLHPGSIKVRIAVFATTNDGHVLDVETGDATPAQAPAWVAMRRAAGADPTVYTNLALWPAVRAAFVAQNVPEPHYWIAHYDNDPTPIAGAVAKQYANPTFTGKHYDLSVVPGTWPGVEENMTDADILAAVNREVGRILADPAFTIQDTVKAIKGQETKETIALRAAAKALTDGLA